MKIQIITNFNSFAELLEEWDNLLVNSAKDNPFLSHQWLQAWWEVYGKGQLYIITCRDPITEKLIGVLPLHRILTGRIIPLINLRFLGSEWVSSDFLGCIALQGRELDVYDAFLMTLRQNVRAWDVIEMRDMDEQSHFCRYLKQEALSGLEIAKDPGKGCPFVNLPDSWEILVNSLSSKMRQRIRYYRKSLMREGEVLLEQISEPMELSAALEDVIRLRQDRLAQKGLANPGRMEDYRRFHSHLVPMFLDSGRLRLYFLTLDGARIAFLYLYAGRKGIFFYQTGFDRSWKKHSVGFVLLGMVIEKSIAEGFEVFEFLRGDERYKYEWPVSGDRVLVDLVIIGESMAARLWKCRRIILLLGRSLIRPLARIWSDTCRSNVK